ncbi:REXO5 exonuclease, partial [Amia calva]|nr:REXO5 exonuclease [Amia calva]
MAVSVRAALKRWREDTTAQDDTPRKSRKLNHEQRAACVHEPQLTKGLPRLSVDVSPSRSPVTHAQLGQLLWFASLGKSCGAKQPSWCRFHHQKQLSGVHVSVLRGVGQHHFYSHYLRFKTLRRTFSTRFSLPPPPPDFLSAVLSADTDRAAQSSCRSAWENPAGRTADAAAEGGNVDAVHRPIPIPNCP